MNPIIQDPIGALRAAVESHQRYTQLTGRELDCITLHPEHCRQILTLVDNTNIRVTIDGTEPWMNNWIDQVGKRPPCFIMVDEEDRFPDCQHLVTSKFTSTGEVYCHDCQKTFTGDIEKHRRSSTIENS